MVTAAEWSGLARLSLSYLLNGFSPPANLTLHILFLMVSLQIFLVFYILFIYNYTLGFGAQLSAHKDYYSYANQNSEELLVFTDLPCGNLHRQILFTSNFWQLQMFSILNSFAFEAR